MNFRKDWHDTMLAPLFTAMTKMTESTTPLTPTDQFAILFVDICEATSTSTDIAMQTCRITEDQSVRLHIPGNNGACTDQGKLSDGHAADDDRACPNRSSIFDQCGCNLPLVGPLKLTIGRNRSR